MVFDKKIFSFVGLKFKVNFFVLLFFLAYFFIGLGIFQDYGISIDEAPCHRRGISAFKYIFEKDLTIFSSDSEISHGQVFEMVLVGLERLFKTSTDSRATFLLRHLATFIFFFIGVIFFYFLCQKKFQDWRLSLLGCFFLVLSPRIFADSFYNSKDIPFLVMFLISIYALVLFLEKKTFFRAAGLALATALTTGIRVMGVMIFFLAIGLVLVDFLRDKAQRSRILSAGVFYAAAAFFLTILFWPTLWRDPVYYFVTAFKISAHYNIGPPAMPFLGKEYSVNQLPWSYLPWWLIVTTPISYTVFFVLGVLAETKSFLKKPAIFLTDQKIDLIVLLWFFIPLFSVIFFKLIVYTGWRHVFFIYPAFLMMALVGLKAFWQSLKIICPKIIFRIIGGLVVVAVAADLGLVGRFMIKHHPYQNLYFNRLAGRDWRSIKKNFLLDYWWLSFSESLEYIFKTDRSPTIEVFFLLNPILGTSHFKLMLPAEDQQRMVEVKDPRQAKYIISRRKLSDKEFPSKKEYYSVKVDNFKINVVYKLR